MAIEIVIKIYNSTFIIIYDVTIIVEIALNICDHNVIAIFCDIIT